MGYLYPHLPRDSEPCGEATTPNCGVLQQIPTILSSPFGQNACSVAVDLASAAL